MFTLIFLVPIILTILVVRLVLRALSFGLRDRRPFMGYGSNSGFGYGHRFGCQRRSGFGGGLFTLLTLVALDRLFTRRW